MSTGPLPPPVRPAIAGATAKAAVQAIAVRLISAPDSLKNNAAPVRVTGTVIEQSKSGSLLVETERGVVELMLKDRQGLPRGTSIDIDIPAGRSPQNATIQASSPQASQNQTGRDTPQPAPTLADRAARYEASSPGFIPDAEILEAVSSYRTSSAERLDARAADLQSRLPSGPLLPGQYVRITPIPPAGTAALATPTVQDFAALLGSLVDAADQSAASGDPLLRASLLSTLSRIDIPASLKTTLTKLYPQLMGALAALTSGAPTASGVPDSGMAAQIKSFNPTLGVDARIVGLPLSSTAGASVALPATSANGATLSLPLTLPVFSGASASPSSPSLAGTTPSLFLLASQPPAGGPSPSGSAPVSLALLSGVTPNQLPVLSVLTPASGLVQNYTVQFQATNLSVQAPAQPQSPSTMASAQPGAAPLTPPVLGGVVSTAGPPLIGSEATSASGAAKISGVSPPIPMLISIETPDSAAETTTWGGLKSLLFELTSADALLADDSLGNGAAAAQHIANLIPTPHQPQSMGALALFFLAMMRSNAPANWLPADASALLAQSARGPGLLKGLAHDVSSASKSESLTASADWRGVNLPLLWDGDIHNLRFHYKHLPDNSDSKLEDERKRRRLRFLFDLQLSRMGGVQVDGFMQDARLDIVLRTKNQLSPPMRERMRQVYAGAMEKSQLIGELSFQYKPEHWVDFEADNREIGVDA